MSQKAEQLPTQQTITRQPLTGSRKIYVPGQLHDIRVAMREISLSDTVSHVGLRKDRQPNTPVTVYDTSGPYTDPDIAIDLEQGLPRLRESWIMNRGDVEQQSAFSSDYANQRLANQSLDALRFAHIRRPLRARDGHNVTQLHYARKGIITPEMEYIAIRENQRIDTLNDAVVTLAAAPRQ